MKTVARAGKDVDGNDASTIDSRWMICMFEEIEDQLRCNKQFEIAEEVKILKRRATSRNSGV